MWFCFLIRLWPKLVLILCVVLVAFCLSGGWRGGDLDLFVSGLQRLHPGVALGFLAGAK